MMNIFWAPKSSNKKIVQVQKYKIEKKNKKLEKQVWKTKKKEKQIELFGHQKSSDFLGDKKQKLNFLYKKFRKVQRVFFEKNQKWKFLNFWNFLFFFDFKLYLIRKSKKFKKFKKFQKFKKFHFCFFQKNRLNFLNFFLQKVPFFLSPKKN